MSTPAVASTLPLEQPLTAAFRGAMTGADAYRAVRAALRLERGTIRLGNRFVGIDQYREIAFVALGNASSSLALAAWESLGERLTQGIVAGPSPLPSSVPFRAWELPLGLPGDPVGVTTAEAVAELAAGLGPKDLLLVLVSPGAIHGLSLPPAGVAPAAWNGWLSALASAGTPGADLERFVRVLGGGNCGGGLGRVASSGEVETLLLDRGDGGTLLGGGPTVPVAAEEVELTRASLQRLGPGLAPPPLATASLRPGASPPAPARAGVRRPVVLLGPGDALGGGSDALVDRRWVCRLAGLTNSDPPEAAAQWLVRRSEEIVGELHGIPGAKRPAGRRGEGPAGLAVFAGLTLGLPEGVDETNASERFLSSLRSALTRRGSVAALFPTAGSLRAKGGDAGGAVTSDPGIAASTQHPFAMRAGLTDVGLVATLLLPAPA
ncbi:MAG TPA: DUF4147 domain-containing protein [Thermoplasmata archaeon]|nr:DUF4147 domain-containing protein [Thermoplasmata archaeon]